jgi:hypothetical protein
MALPQGVFDTDPDATQRKERTKPENNFTFRSGYQENNQAKTLTKWRVTATTPETASALAELFGGSPREMETSADEHVEVFTDAVEVPVLIDGPDAIDAPLIQWGANGVILHKCDGVTTLEGDPREAGVPCGCPTELRERKARAKKGLGPKPNITVRLKLMADEDLGIGQVKSGAWDFLLNLFNVAAELERIGEPAVGVLKLHHVQYSTDTRDVSYRHPVIHSLRSYNDAVAE